MLIGLDTLQQIITDNSAIENDEREEVLERWHELIRKHGPSRMVDFDWALGFCYLGDSEQTTF